MVLRRVLLEESGNITYLRALLFVKTTARTALIICLFAAVMGIISELLLRQDSFQFPPNVSLQSILKVAAELVCLGDILDYLIYTFVFMYFQGYRLILQFEIQRVKKFLAVVFDIQTGLLLNLSTGGGFFGRDISLDHYLRLLNLTRFLGVVVLLDLGRRLVLALLLMAVILRVGAVKSASPVSTAIFIIVVIVSSLIVVVVIVIPRSFVVWLRGRLLPILEALPSLLLVVV